MAFSAAIRRASIPPRARRRVSHTVPPTAEDIGLRYTSPDSPGIARRRRGKSFSYVAPDGKLVTDRDTLLRIRSLVIPPAWSDVWISPYPNGHIQAVGRDARNRKQYRYHPKWRQVRDQSKFDKMMAFARALPALRRAVKKDLAQPGLSRDKVLAAVIRLLETTFIRVGNEEYARTNDSFGLTTMKNKHAAVRRGAIHFHFRGKSGVEHAIDLSDKRLATIVKQCQDLPGHDLFNYLDDAGQVHDIKSEDVNAYLRTHMGDDFTAKDFRTWAGTILAAAALRAVEAADSKKQANQNILRAVESVAKRLGNTKAVCRKCYIHPGIFDCYLNGTLAQSLKSTLADTLKHDAPRLSPTESAVVELLRSTARSATHCR